MVLLRNREHSHVRWFIRHYICDELHIPMASTQEIVDCVECAAVGNESTTNGDAPASQPARPAEKVEEDVMDSTTFTPPDLSVGPAITIEYCDRCRWAPRASWIATELFLTFPNPALSSITLMPSVEHAGRFRIWLKLSGSESQPTLLWDRKIEGGFPELKVLKQRVRDRIQPNQDLGHSDKHKHAARGTAAS